MPGPLMSALWTPGRAGVSQGFLWQSPALPSRVLLHPSLARRLRRVPVVMVGRRFRFESRPESAQVGLLHEGRDPLAKGYPYCTNPRPPWSTPDLRAMAPDARAVQAVGRDCEARSRARPNPRDVGRLDGWVRAGGEGLRGVGVHGADISPESVLYARAKLRHSNDPSWVQGHRGR